MRYGNPNIYGYLMCHCQIRLTESFMILPSKSARGSAALKPLAQSGKPVRIIGR